MATQLFNIVRFTNIAAGATVSIAHGLNWNDTDVVPDRVMWANAAFTVTADSAFVTATNTGAVTDSTDVLVEAFHTLLRAFGSEQTTTLTPQPFYLPGITTATASSFPSILYSSDPTLNVTVYLDGANGDDANTGLSAAEALQTFHAVNRKFPQRLFSDAKILVMVAGVGTAGTTAFTAPTAPLTYTEPTFIVGGPGSSAHNGYCIRAAPMCAANPTTGPTTAALDVVPCVEIDQANAAAPGTGRRTRFDFTVAAPGWTANNFRNSKFYLRVTRAGVDVIPETPIVENTANSLTIDIVCTAQILSTDTVTIVRPSVEFTGEAADFNAFKITGQGSQAPFDTQGIGAAGNGNTIERVAFTGRPLFENFIGGLDTCSASGSSIVFQQCAVVLYQCKFQTSIQMYNSAFNLQQGSPRFTSAGNPINQGVAFRTTLCAVGTMTIGDPRGGCCTFQYDDVLSHYGGSALRVWGPGSALSCVGSASANLLGSGATGNGLWSRFGAKCYVNTGTQTQVTGTTGALRVGASATIVAYGTGAGQFEEVAGFNGNLYRMNGSVATAPTGDESQIALTSIV